MHWKENALWKLELYKPAVWPHIKLFWPFVAPCKWYLTLATITTYCWDGWAGGWLSGNKAHRMRLCGDAGQCRGQPFFSIQADKAPCPQQSLRALFFAFPPSPRELSKNTGHTEQAQQTGSFPFTFLCPLEEKAVPCLWPEVYWGCSFSPGADVVQDWLLCPFPWRECGFPFSCGNEPRPLVLGAHKLILNFLSLRRTL